MAISLAYYFKGSTPKLEMNSALEQCNKVLLVDFGPRHVLEDAPDMLVVAGESWEEAAGVTAVGLLTLHYTEATRAWELGTMSALRKGSHGQLFQLFMEHVPNILVARMDASISTRPVWIVKRVKQSSAKHINMLMRMGFEQPPHFLVGVLSDDGYIPFDPFDELLMKLRVCPQQQEVAAST